MRTLIVVLMVAALLAGCNGKAITPYGKIETQSENKVLAYTDADVRITADGTKSDDTTLIVVGVKDNTGANLETIFVRAMEEIREIFKARQAVYETWVDKRP